MTRIAGAVLVLATVAATAGCGAPKRVATPAGPVPGAGCTSAVASGRPVAGVVSLSAPGIYSGVDADGAARKLAVAVLYAACRSDVEFAESTSRLAAETPAAAPHALVVEECSGHGVDLLGNGGPAYDHVRAAVTDFL